MTSSQNSKAQFFMETTQPSLSIVIPAYNEGAHIYANLMHICEVMKRTSFEIIVVDDGSLDNTFHESLRAAQETHKILVLHQEKNCGKGAALVHGFEHARGNLISFLDADLEIAPENLLEMIRTLQEKNADVVVGVKDLRRTPFPLLRRIMSYAYRMLISYLFDLNLSDTQTGIKLFRREVLENALPHISTRRFAFDLELLIAVLRLGHSIVEYPVSVMYRRRGKLGRVTPSQITNMLLDTVMIFYRVSFLYWLNPGWVARIWMGAFVLGIFLTGIGFAKLLTLLIPRREWVKQFFYFFLLQFIPTPLREWLIFFSGLLLVGLSLIELNKIVMNAFIRVDRGGLADLSRGKRPVSQKEKRPRMDL